MSSCCPSETSNTPQGSCGQKEKPDYLLWGSAFGVAFLYLGEWLAPDFTANIPGFSTLAETSFELMNMMWWGLLIGIVMVAFLSKVPREFVIAVLGRKRGLNSILRATAGGVLLDLCNHGILMVAAKLYERGASAGQVVAFLIASPWNSFSLTLILVALIGLKWTLGFIALSMVIAIITGLAFDWLVKRGTLPENPNTIDLPEGFHLWSEAKKGVRNTEYNAAFFKELAISGIKDSRMVLRWILFGVLLAGLIRTFMDAQTYGTYFGPTLMGLGLTMVAATIIEVCSEGSTPIAADLLTRANAPGNSFAFLMGGAATDYTEIMILRDMAKSWAFALMLPLISLPQVLIVAWMINTTGL